MMLIDWARLTSAIHFYAAAGYQYRELPWTAPAAAIEATLPADAVPTTLSTGEMLVGSAEQSFLAAAMAGDLPPGRYMSLTPCFRQEPVHDDLHRPYFAKLELWDSEETSVASLLRMVDLAREFFHRAWPTGAPFPVEVRWTGQHAYDIEIGEVEVGSYGFRQRGEHVWLYGTGLAEPRFETVRRRHFPDSIRTTQHQSGP